MRRRGDRKITDERILGSGAFVQKILDEAEEAVRNKFTGADQRQQIDNVIRRVCQEQGVDSRELRLGSRRNAVSAARALITTSLVREHGVSLAEAARNLGVTSSGIFRILKRNER